MYARIKRRLEGRFAIEAVIAHHKNVHCMDRNLLHGFTGDKINALMAA